ncbi:MAG: hypothetical protein EKK32_31635, partial [Bradyrhizobiaceae bacterium]
YGEKGNENNPLPGTKTAIEFNSEPIRLTFDASKAFMGDKHSHFVDVWVAYHYWQNKFGLDRKVSAVCRGNSTCTEETLYAGVTVKF